MESVKPSAVTTPSKKLARNFAKVLHLRAFLKNVTISETNPKDETTEINWSESFNKVDEDEELQEQRVATEALLAKVFASVSTVKETEEEGAHICQSTVSTTSPPPQNSSLNHLLTNTTTIFLADSTADRCTPSQFTIRRPSRVTTSLRSEQPSPPFSDANCDLQRHPHEASHIAAPCYSRSESNYSSINRSCPTSLPPPIQISIIVDISMLPAEAPRCSIVDDHLHRQQFRFKF